MKKIYITKDFKVKPNQAKSSDASFSALSQTKQAKVKSSQAARKVLYVFLKNIFNERGRKKFKK